MQSERSDRSTREIPGDRWTLFWREDDTLEANPITPTFGGGGLVVVREQPLDGTRLVRLTRDEVEALYGATFAVPNISFGGDAPTAILSAQAKLAAVRAQS